MRVNFSCLFIVLLASRSGWAQQAPLVVERGTGAEQCPDADTLSARVEQIRGRAEHELASRYHVVFTRREDVFAAVISTGPGGANARVLENSGPTCSALANATAVTLALLFDSDVKQKPPPPSVPAPPPVAAEPVVAPAQKLPSPRYATLAVGAAGLAGVLRPVSLALIADGGFAGPRWRASIGALWGLPQTIPLGPGTVREQLLSGFSRACLAPWTGGSLRFDLCSGAVFGFMTGEGQGYSRNERRTQPWVAIPLEFALAGFHTSVGWELSVAAMVTLRAFGILPF